MQDPIDVRTIGERLEAGFYTSLEMFAADFRRMFNNARIYNAPETLYYKVCATRQTPIEVRAQPAGAILGVARDVSAEDVVS